MLVPKPCLYPSEIFQRGEWFDVSGALERTGIDHEESPRVRSRQAWVRTNPPAPPLA
jgi:hypothetical protein